MIELERSVWEDRIKAAVNSCPKCGSDPILVCISMILVDRNEDRIFYMTTLRETALVPSNQLTAGSEERGDESELSCSSGEILLGAIKCLDTPEALCKALTDLLPDCLPFDKETGSLKNNILAISEDCWRDEGYLRFRGVYLSTSQMAKG